MPLYGYECSLGHRFDLIKSIDSRHNAVCPVCDNSASLMVSAWGRVIMASAFRVIDSNGRVLENKPTTNRIPYQGITYSGGKSNAVSS